MIFAWIGILTLSFIHMLAMVGLFLFTHHPFFAFGAGMSVSTIVCTALFGVLSEV